MRAIWALPILWMVCHSAPSTAKSIFDDAVDKAPTPAGATRPAAPSGVAAAPADASGALPPMQPALGVPAAPTAAASPSLTTPSGASPAATQPAPGAEQGAANAAPAPAAPPKAAALVEAYRLINDVYRVDIAAATTASAKQALSEKLAAAASHEQDPPTKYALLMEVRRFSAAAGDCAMSFGAIDVLRQAFEIDDVKLRLDTVKEIDKSAKASADRLQLARGSADLVERAVETCRYDIARAVAAIELKNARQAGSAVLVAQATADVPSIKEAEEAHGRYELAMTVLKSKPDDGPANLTVGKFICLSKGDMNAGLPYLARGGDPFLKEVAMRDMANPAEPIAQVKAGDAWYDLSASQTGAVKRHLRDRALYWYTKASPLLDGLQATKVQQRLDALKPVARQGLAAAAPAAAPDAVDPAAAAAKGPAATPQSRREKIDKAIKDHKFTFGMTLDQASEAIHVRGELVNAHMYAGHERRTYRFLALGLSYTTYIQRSGYMYELHHSTPMSGIIAYVDATFEDDAMTSFIAHPGGQRSLLDDDPR